MLPHVVASVSLVLLAHAAQIPGSSTCDLAHIDVRLLGMRQKFVKEIQGKAAVILDGAVDDSWPTRDWTFSEWQRELSTMTLPRRRILSVAKAGALHTAEELPGDQLFNSSLRAEVDPWMIFSTSRQDAAVDRLNALGAFKQPPILASVNRQPVLSIGAAGDGLAYHQHEEAWLALLHGAKQWFLRRPEATPSITHRRLSADILAEESDTIKCTQQAGEIIYFPRGWWHATYNLEHGASNLTVGVGGLGREAVGGDTKDGGFLLPGNVEGLEVLLSQEGSEFQKWISNHGVYMGAMAGHAEVLRWLLDHLPRSNWDPLPLFQIAASRGHTSIASMLLAHRVHVDGRVRKFTPLHLAAENGHRTMMEWLLKNRADVHAKDAEGLQPLHHAAHKGHVDATSWLLTRDLPELRSTTPKANLALAAAADGHLELLEFLHARGYSFDGMDQLDSWLDPLYCAITNGHGEVVEWFFQQGILQRLHADSSAPVQWATKDGRIDALSVFLERSTQSASKLHYAGFYGREGVSAWLLRDGVRLCSVDFDGQATAHAIAINSQAVLALLSEAATAEEKRMDPEDGVERTFCELHADVPLGEYSDQEIDDYWRTLQPLPSGSDPSLVDRVEAHPTDEDQRAKALVWLRTHGAVEPSDPRVASQLGHSRVIQWLLSLPEQRRDEL